MKDRIKKLMTDKAMSQRTFANELCLAEATLSGIFNGRTRPTNQTISAIHERFPDVNIQWLMFGEGDMYNTPGSGVAVETSSVSDFKDNTTASTPQQMDLFSDAKPSDEPNNASGHNIQVPVTPEIRYVEKIVDKPQRKITEIRIFFDDGTYETFTK